MTRQTLRHFLIVMLTSIIAAAGVANAQVINDSTVTQKENRINFANEFLREIKAVYQIQKQWESELPEDPSASGKLLTGKIGRAHVELQSHSDLVCRLLLEKKKKKRR